MSFEPRDHLPLPHLWYNVLLALAGGEQHGWAIIKRIRELSHGRADPSSGSLYLAMQRLVESGLIEETEAPGEAGAGDERRRYYRLTASGRAVLRAETDRLSMLVELARRVGVLDGPVAGLAEADA